MYLFYMHILRALHNFRMAKQSGKFPVLHPIRPWGSLEASIDGLPSGNDHFILGFL